MLSFSTIRMTRTRKPWLRCLWVAVSCESATACACGPSSPGLFVEVDSCVRARASLLELELLNGSCESDDVRHEQTFRIEGQGSSPPTLPPGRYGIRFTALAGTSVVAERCEVVTLPTDEDVVVRLTASCPDTGAPDTATPDTATPDTATPDTATPDAGPDADAGIVRHWHRMRCTLLDTPLGISGAYDELFRLDSATRTQFCRFDGSRCAVWLGNCLTAEAQHIHDPYPLLDPLDQHTHDIDLRIYEDGLADLIDPVDAIRIEGSGVLYGYDGAERGPRRWFGGVVHASVTHPDHCHDFRCRVTTAALGWGGSVARCDGICGAQELCVPPGTTDFCGTILECVAQRSDGCTP